MGLKTHLRTICVTVRDRLLGSEIRELGQVDKNVPTWAV